MKNPILYRISQFVGFLLGARVFVTAMLTFALYVTTFFLFSPEESLSKFVFDFKVHAIIFCAILSILAGGIINQFYDREKDQLTKPFRTRIQSFLKQKYFLYAYIFISVVSLGIAAFISVRVFVFFLVYQFLMWFYSHKLSKIVIVNNLTFVSLSLYPFFGMLVYYRTFSLKIFLMAIFLFLMLLITDIIKDFLTKNADRVFGYQTIPNYFGSKVSKIITVILMIAVMLVSCLIISKTGLHSMMNYYFVTGIFVMIFCIFQLLGKHKNAKFFALNILRLWIFLGICAMLADGIFLRYSIRF